MENLFYSLIVPLALSIGTVIAAAAISAWWIGVIVV